MKLETLLKNAVRGDDRSLARCMSVIESGGDNLKVLRQMIPPSSGRALKVGITGSPGCGKSTMISKILELPPQGKGGVGIIAVDPSSPITGGAMLGDRVRLGSQSFPPDVFFRSLATHGTTGGLSVPVYHMMRLLEAAGKGVIIFETTGVGQQEIDVAFLADVVILVLNPHSGDDMQFLKAGVLETADLLVVNKSDLGGADRLKIFIQNYLENGNHRPVLLQTNAVSGEGIREMWDQVVSYREKNIRNIRSRKMRLRKHMVLRLVQERVRDLILRDERLIRILEGSEPADPFEMAELIEEEIFGEIL